jgi:ribosome biogenesis GTPase
LGIDQGKGLITKILGGFYYVEIKGETIECRARGLFRKDKIKPLVGDYCQIRLTKEDPTKGYVEKICARKNESIRPPVANIDQMIVVFSIRDPDINLRLLDKFLIQNEMNKIDSTICINKIDYEKDDALELKRIYEKAGYRVMLTSAEIPDTLEDLKQVLKDRLSAFSGPSGVGKSTLLNKIDIELNLKTGDISDKSKRGKHTTRHVELFKLNSGGWVVDTAGFSTLDLNKVTKDNLKHYFLEFKCGTQCRFSNCNHISEPDCQIKKQVNDDKISTVRYNSYKELYAILQAGGEI